MGEAVGGRQGSSPAKEGDDRGSQSGDRTVGAVVLQSDQE